MNTRLGLRGRLTLLVTVVFASALSITAVTVLDAVEGRLVDDTRASAESVLGTYLESIFGGVAGVGVIDPAETARFFYLDADGEELTERQYFEMLAADFDREFANLVGDGAIGDGAIVTSGPVVGVEVVDGPVAAEIGAIEIDPETGVIAVGGTAIDFSTGPVPAGAPSSIDLGDDVVAVAQTIRLGDGVTVQVGVSNPLQPVTDSLDTIRRLLWFAIPVLVAAIAVTTWVATSRALRPVQAITSQTDVITAMNTHERVPVPSANDEIRDLALTMNGMLQRLDEAQHRQRQLVADASHELRSPVAASRAQLDVATANPDDTDWIATAHAVLAEQEHLSRLIDDLLILSRLDEVSSGSRGHVEVDVDDLITVEAARHACVGTNISEPVRVHGDPALLTRAIRNLVDNAIRHCVERVVVTLESPTDQVVVHVDDDGAGIPPDQRADVFERFVRLDEARDRQHGGAGLGLAIARSVARAHGGDVICTTGPLGGARFTLTLAAPTNDDQNGAHERP